MNEWMDGLMENRSSYYLATQRKEIKECQGLVVYFYSGINKNGIIVTDLVRKFACAVLLGRLSKLIEELCVLHEAAAKGGTTASRSTC